MIMIKKFKKYDDMWVCDDKVTPIRFSVDNKTIVGTDLEGAKAILGFLKQAISYMKSKKKSKK